MATWIVVYLDGDYYSNHFRNVFAAYIHPFIVEYKGTNARCVTLQNMTEAEYKFTTSASAKAAKKAITKALKALPKTILSGRSIVTIMPEYYERNGFRCIVRPDFHSEALSVASVIPGFPRITLAKKYATRLSPQLPASDYCGVEMKGVDKKTYVSTKSKTGACQWKLA